MTRAAKTSVEDVRKHVKVYLLVFAALAILTGVTVGIYYLHVPKALAIGLAITIATVKASLVALYFMHLISEKKLIYWVLALCAAFFLVLMLVPLFTNVEMVV